LVLRETREEESAIEEETTRRKRQAKNYLYQSIQTVPFNFRMLFVTLASETKTPLVSPIYTNNVQISLNLSFKIQADDPSNVHLIYTTKMPCHHLSRQGGVCVISGV
jgi:hypothetical protein